jgi:hypothetical protein
MRYALKTTYKKKVKWETAQEHDNRSFDVERQLPNGTAWAKPGFVAAAPDYRFTDKNPFPGVNYYRLKQGDNDRSFSNLPIVSVKIEAETFEVSVYLNPASEQIFVRPGPAAG